MFIRRTSHIDSKNKSTYYTYKLVESRRTERGPRQSDVLNLGADFDLPEGQWKALANRIEEILTGQTPLVAGEGRLEELARKYAEAVRARRAEAVGEEVGTGEAPAADYRSVDLNAVENEQARPAGAEQVVLQAMGQLGLAEKLRELGLNEAFVAAAVGVLAGRLIAPRSERWTHRWLQEGSALGELMGADFSEVSQDRVYRAGDLLLRHREALEAHLRGREQGLFGLGEQVLLYDLTNTFLEGTGKYNGKAKYGMSKEKRTDCPLVTLGLLLDGDGFPKRSRVYAGNVGEGATLREVLSDLAFDRGLWKPLVVLDAGITSEENLAYLRAAGYDYIVVARGKKGEVPPEAAFVTVREDRRFPVRAAKVEKDGETWLYCRSEAKRATEEGIRDLYSRRFEEGLRLAAAALTAKGGTKRHDKVMERIGRLKERCKRVAHRYDIAVGRQGDLASGIEWTRKPERQSGVYVLRCSRRELGEKEGWDVFNVLRDVEDAFRCMKSDLGLRPVHHQIERRTDAHVFLTVLAYHVLQTVRTRLRAAGIHDSWSTVRQRLSTQVRVTTILKTQDGQTVHLRKATRPDLYQKSVYDALGLPSLPGRTVKSVF